MCSSDLVACGSGRGGNGRRRSATRATLCASGSGLLRLRRKPRERITKEPAGIHKIAYYPYYRSGGQSLVIFNIVIFTLGVGLSIPFLLGSELLHKGVHLLSHRVHQR